MFLLQTVLWYDNLVLTRSQCGHQRSRQKRIHDHKRYKFILCTICARSIFHRTFSATTVQVDAPSDAGFTPLHISAQEGHLSTVRVLVEKGGSRVGSLTKTGANPIYWAAHFGKMDVIKYLIEKGTINRSTYRIACYHDCYLYRYN